ncbi:hypothetical protein LDL08_41220 [Nonomuraea glycinis]|uniref:Uncharacterized protein n=1 Tax=Nonomuraea glycinis TaxID=2047744 RepID=A0A918ADP0_9ACTN|nr:hypothetical protein [Nonomuraea glycinis]MCA2182603.1 hypothetical protein [Nonomuraea glycinis]GGP16882.1 hypothetical protein GCM10012278_82460 [Nonomuraea glycinis]
MTHTSPTFFTDLVDDAGLFPPTSLHMSEALGRHERDQERGTRMLTHRFLCPTSRLDALRRESFRPRRIGLIVDTEEIPPFDDLPVDFVEVRLNDDLSLDRTARELRETLPPDVRLFVEVLPRKHFSDVPKGVELKVRCGGAEAHDFPQAEQLAGFIRFCADNDIPFKATAGLHRAVRHFDPTLGVDRHGFLNLLLAVCEAVEHRDPAPVLRSTDVGHLVRMARAVPEETAERARHLLVSYGSCSTVTPIEDMLALGLIEEDA